MSWVAVAIGGGALIGGGVSLYNNYQQGQQAEDMQNQMLQANAPNQQLGDDYRERLKGLLNTGDSQFQNLYKDTFSRDIMPQIQQQYQAKRGMGAGSTPEIAALGKAGSQLGSNLSSQAFQSRNELLSMLGSSIPGTVTPLRQGGSSIGQGAANLGSSALNNYLKRKQQEDLLSKYLSNDQGGSAQNLGQGEWLQNYFNNQSAISGPTGSAAL